MTLRSLLSCAFLAFAATSGVAACSAETKTPATAKASPAPLSTAPATPSACPPPKQTTDACAAVIAYAKNPANGACCLYGTPCDIPFPGQPYSDARCSQPAGPPLP